MSTSALILIFLLSPLTCSSTPVCDYFFTTSLLTPSFLRNSASSSSLSPSPTSVTTSHLTIIPRTSTFAPTCFTLSRVLPCHHLPPQLLLTTSPLIIIPRTSTFLLACFLLWPYLPLPLSQERLHFCTHLLSALTASPLTIIPRTSTFTLILTYFDLLINHSMCLFFVITSLLTPLFPPQRRAFLVAIFSASSSS